MKYELCMIRKMLVVFPHELVPELARLGMLPEVNAQGFWEHAQSTGVEWAVPADGTMRRPMGLYGDDAQYDKNQNKLLIATLNHMLSPASHSME